MAEVRSLAVLRDATRMLAECRTIEDAKKLADLAEAAKVYAEKAHLGEEAIQYAWEVKIDALTLVGSMIVEGQEQGAVRRPGQKPNCQEPVQLEVLGLTRNESSIAQFLSMLLEENAKAHGAVRARKLSVEKARRLYRHRKQRKDAKRKSPELTRQFDVDIRRGDFREVLKDIPADSVKMILTDPPYGKESLPLWGELGKFAARVLRKDGLLVAYSGQLYLPEVIASLGEHLDWWWLCGVAHKGSGNLTPLGHPVRKVINQFKPLLIFVKRGGCVPDTFNDLVEGSGSEKGSHNWQQPVAEAVTILQCFCPDDDALVVDPFAGSGAFGQAAKELGLRFIGAEVLGSE